MSRYNVNWQIANAINNEALIAGTDSGKSCSPKLWSNCPYLALQYGAKEGFVYFNDFMDAIEPTDDKGWALTQVDTKGSIAADATAQGGVLTVTSATGNSADDGINAQLPNCLVKPAAGVKIWFETRVKMGDATQQYYIGLAGACTALIASGVVDDTVNKCGFYHEAASTDNYISAVAARLGADSKITNIGANADATYVKLGFLIDGISRIDFFRNGIQVGSCNTAANIPNAVMCLSACAQYEDADGVMSIDWVRIAQEGGRA